MIYFINKTVPELETSEAAMCSDCSVCIFLFRQRTSPHIWDQRNFAPLPTFTSPVFPHTVPPPSQGRKFIPGSGHGSAIVTKEIPLPSTYVMYYTTSINVGNKQFLRKSSVWVFIYLQSLPLSRNYFLDKFSLILGENNTSFDPE